MLWPLPTSSRTPSQRFSETWSANPKKQHTGVDLPANATEQVLACANGTVSKIGGCGTSPSGEDWGKFIFVEHDNADITTCYLHTDPRVNEGQRVIAGDIIGLVKDLKRQSHLHFGVWRGQKNAITPRGALPFPEFAGKIGPFFDDPAFPSSFVDPLSFTYEDASSSPEDPVSEFPIKRDLSKGCAEGPDIEVLQQLLNKDPHTCVAISGPGSPGQESSTFGELTEKAVQRFQEKHGIVAANQLGYGIVGPRTRNKLQGLFWEREPEDNNTVPLHQA